MPDKDHILHPYGMSLRIFFQMFALSLRGHIQLRDTYLYMLVPLRLESQILQRELLHSNLQTRVQHHTYLLEHQRQLQ